MSNEPEVIADVMPDIEPLRGKRYWAQALTPPWEKETVMVEVVSVEETTDEGWVVLGRLGRYFITTEEVIAVARLVGGAHPKEEQ
jgi:hypothetical protein